jgi:hypothetical protein
MHRALVATNTISFSKILTRRDENFPTDNILDEFFRDRQSDRLFRYLSVRPWIHQSRKTRADRLSESKFAVFAGSDWEAYRKRVKQAKIGTAPLIAPLTLAHLYRRALRGFVAGTPSTVHHVANYFFASTSVDHYEGRE